MKRILACLFLLIAPAWATTAVTGNLKNLSGANVSGGFVRFWLRGCAGNQPRVANVGLIAPTLGGVYFFDFVADPTGAISGTLYSNRDATGNGNGEIECGGQYNATWYGMQAFLGGKGGPEVAVLAKNTATIDISNVIPISSNPTTPSNTPYVNFDSPPAIGDIAPNSGAFTSVTATNGLNALLPSQPVLALGPDPTGTCDFPAFWYATGTIQLCDPGNGTLQLNSGTGNYQVFAVRNSNGTPASGSVPAYVAADSDFELGAPTVISNLNHIVYIDGVTYPATLTGIQSGINALGGSGRVIVPFGTYSGTSLTVPDGVTIEGDGRGATILQITGNGTTAISIGSASLRKLKIDGSTFTGANLLTSTNDTGSLDDVLIIGNADDTLTTNAVRIPNNNWRFNKVNFDKVLEVVITGDNFKASGTVFTNFRTGFWLQNVTNSELDGTSCISYNYISGPLTVNGMDCVLGDGLQTVTISNTVVKTGREHGIYLSGGGSSPNRSVKVTTVNCQNLYGDCVKVHQSSTNIANAQRDISILDVTNDNPQAVSTSGCMQLDEIVGLNVQHVTCRGNSGTVGSHAIDLQGLLDHGKIAGVFAELNTGDGINVQDANGPLTHLKLSDVQCLNNSQSGVGNFSCIEARLTAASGYASTDWDFSNIEGDDTQGTHTQAWVLQLDNLLNGATLTRFTAKDIRGQGNTSGVIQAVPAGISNYNLATGDGHDYTSFTGIDLVEGSGSQTFAGHDICYGMLATHDIRCNFNNGNGGAFWKLSQTIGSGNVTTAGTAVSAGACQAQTGITVTGAATTDNVIANIGATLPVSWQTGIVLSAHVTASNTVTVYLCNPTAGGITPVATQVNVRVVR